MVDFPTARLSFSVLGPLSVQRDGKAVPVGGLRQRVVLAMLLMNAGRPVSVERLIDGLWDDDPPAGAVNTLQVYISHLRRNLGGGDATISTQPPGYLLGVTAAQLDLLRFEQLVQRAEERVRQRRPAEAIEEYGRALALWRGVPLEDLGAGSFADSARVFLEERRLGVTDDRLQLLLDAGRHREVIQTCHAVLATASLRESVWEKLIIALYRSGRQADALAQYRACRKVLLDELGVEPMPRLRLLERQILNHDKTLDPEPRDRGASIIQARPTVFGQTTLLQARRLNAELVLADGSVVALADRLVLGRRDDCDVVLDDSSVSRRHAEIRLANGRHVLLDLSSSNGTWVAGQPVMQHLLADGDTFQIGDQILRYRTR
jgi:SARP family transcriptional regulator, regulator of embCAB operon